MTVHNILLSSLVFFVACGEKDSDTATENQNDGISNQEGFGTVTFDNGVTTLAGSGEMISLDGNGMLASFAEPKAIRLRSDGVLIVADSLTGQIRMVDPLGTVESLEMSGPKPVSPSGLAVTDDAIYVSDYDQHCIFKIEETVSTVLAGTCGETGYQNGVTALFENPRGLAIDGEGNLLVADAGNNAIRSISPNGEVVTIAGTGEKYVASSEGPVLEANVYIPFGLAIHPNGDLFFSGFDHCIRRIHDGTIEDVAGLCLNYGNTGTSDGIGIDARFDTPLDIAFTPDGSLIIADAFNDRLRILSPDRSVVTTLTGQAAGYQDGSLEEALFEIPRSVAVDANGNIYVADSINHRIRVVVR